MVVKKKWLYKFPPLSLIRSASFQFPSREQRGILAQTTTGNRTSGIVRRSFDLDADHPKERHPKFVVVIYFLSFFFLQVELF